MRGKILSGLDQAQYFLTCEGYSRQFLERFGFVHFFGTLDVLLEEPFPTEGQAIKIEGFSEEGRTFGQFMCYPINLDSMQPQTRKRRWLPSGPGGRAGWANGRRRSFLSEIPCSHFA